MASHEETIQPWYMVCLNVNRKPCLVIGGGEVARRKAATLSDCGGLVTVISPKVDPIIEYMVQQNELQWIAREFETVDITDQYMVVIAATDNREVNHQISRICLEQRILCNVVDQPDEGSFIVPSTVERGPLTIGISTSGISPTLASSIRQELEMAYGEEYGTFLEFMSTVRQQVIDLFPLPKQRQKIFDRMISSRAISLLRSGMKEAALKELQHIIDEGRNDPSLSQGGALPIIS